MEADWHDWKLGGSPGRSKVAVADPRLFS